MIYASLFTVGETMTAAFNETDPLAAPSDDLLGRQLEVQALLQATQTTSAVEVVGPPGVGKSTVLRHLLNQIEEAWLIDLTECHNDQDILTHTAIALDIPLQPADDQDDDWFKTTRAQVELALSHHKNNVLIFDNAEHVLDALMVHVSQWTVNTPAHIIWGSRKSTNREDVHTVELEPWHHAATDWSTHPGVILFQEVAARLGRAWHKPEHIDHISKIVQRVQGLPLAIELIASRSSLLNPSTLLARMGNSAMPSVSLNQHLHNTVEWSWQLLDAQTQDVLTQCAMFRGGFTLAALESMYQDQPVDVFECIEHLRQHALIYIEETPTNMRGKLLLYIRDFVSQHITQAHIDRYLSYMSDLAHTLYIKTQGYVWAPQAAQLYDEHQNIIYAYEQTKDALTASKNNDSALPDQLAKLAMARLMVARWFGHFPTVDTIRADRDTFDLSNHTSEALSLYLELAYQDSRAIQWKSMLAVEPLLALKQRAFEHGDERLECWIIIRLVSYLPEVNEEALDKCLPLFERGMALARARQDELAQQRLLSAVSLYYIRRYELIKATAICFEAIEMAKKLGCTRDEAKSLSNLSFAYQCLGDFQKAHEPMVKAVQHFQDSQDIIGTAQTLRMFCWYAIDERRLEEARVAVDKLLRLASRHGLSWINGMAHLLNGQLLIEELQFKQATISLERAARYFEHEQRFPLLAASKLFQSLAFELLRDLDQAKTSFEQAQQHMDVIKGLHATTHLTCAHATWMVRAGNIKGAQKMLDTLKASLPEDSTLLHALIDVSQCSIELANLTKAQSANKVRAIKKHQTTLLSLLSSLMRSTDDNNIKAPINRDLGLRIGCMLVRQQLPDMLNKRLDIELQDPQAKALLVDLQNKAYRPPDHTDWVDMSNRATPFKLLEVLILERLNRPGNALDMDTLCERVWSDEVIMPDAASNRLYVTISTLRRAGLKEMIISEQKGYMLCPGIPLFEVA